MYEFIAMLYSNHAQEITVALALSVGDPSDEEDIVHETFIRSIEHEEELVRHPSPRGWLFRTSYNLSRDRRKRLFHRRHKLAQLYPVIPEVAWEDALDLRASLKQLSRQQRDAVILHYYLGFPLNETARILGCAEGTIKSHLYRARNTLERSLGHSGAD